MMIKFKFHSIVDVITNSSTVIYTHQDSVTEAKQLVAEVLKLMGSQEDPEDAFYYGVFHDTDVYTDRIDEEEVFGFPEVYTQQGKWMEGMFLRIMKGVIEQPEWMDNIEEDATEDMYLHLVPKEEKYEPLGKAIEKLLCSVTADESND